mmetsp:Transcript_5812/g.7775  ORF Transcript_5812/g.7775 Transcript_5812/m.7775 type:complete len:194 (+) Transcript_5812:1300-1881(+)
MLTTHLIFTSTLKIYKCCSKYKEENLKKNILTGEINCKSCGTIITSNPYNDGADFLSYSQLENTSGDRFGKELVDDNINKDLFTTVGKGKNVSFKFHVLSSTNINKSMIRKIENICDSLYLPKIVIDESINLFIKYGRSIKSKKSYTKACCFIFFTSRKQGFSPQFDDFVKLNKTIRKKDMYKYIKHLEYLIR